MDSTPPFSSLLDFDVSTGYLQDALCKSSSKRRRLLWLDDDQPRESIHPVKSCWNSQPPFNSYENFAYLSQVINNSAESTSRSADRMNEDATMFSEMKTSDETISTSETADSSLSSHKGSANTTSMSDKEVPYPINTISSGVGEKRKRRVLTRVVYPFEVVKPGGIDEGDVTLDDINERILMPPSRPVRHPVGDFACRSLVSPDGTGLSGKAVVALTRIYTQGRGTITIIRTKD